MPSRSPVAWDVLRWIMALWFFSGGFVVLGHTFLGHPRFPPVPPAAQSLLDAFQESGFLYPLLAAVYLIGGGALFMRRTAPLGLVMLAAPIGVIVGFHVMLSRMYAVAALLVLGYLPLCWHERDRLACLWRKR